MILANCFSRGKNFFRPSNLLFAILLPSAALWGFSEWENKTFVADGVHTRQVKRARAIKNEKAHMLAVFRDTTQLKDSPVIVHYSWPGNYIIEAGIILLFAAGLWAGRRSRLLWLAFSFFSLDMVLHIGLGFGINEVYIMTAHWAYVIPVSIGFLIKGCTGKRRNAITVLTAILTLYLITYNSILTLLSL